MYLNRKTRRVFKTPIAAGESFKRCRKEYVGDFSRNQSPQQHSIPSFPFVEMLPL